MSNNEYDVAVIGAGHAGVEAARVIAASAVDVDLYSAESDLPYFRPRLVALVSHSSSNKGSGTG